MTEGARAKALQCAQAALEKKAYDLVILDVYELCGFADAFVICSGRSDRQVQAIAEGIEESLDRSGIRPLGVEGLPTAHWVLLDYADVIVHIFYNPVREFYDLEGLWSRAPQVALPAELAALQG
ncbi:MAG: ribosome silencing factor [Deltaproteobacteria bacterium]|nr:ribosome silencing factor [Deltaproteobacteria bacterium]